ncbi:hypothetical protein PV327_002917 [Microctonus hyperodae]|uniref:Uncharacterized protein n=1 Tax=Microctonus hyperodae TaxID=165561 RepID=A0AA39L0H2_MICHY|nr:hypothetical protein PV327_002917 [Microctonus hyperodae]
MHRRNLALKMAVVNKKIHLLSLALIFFIVINFPGSWGYGIPCNDGYIYVWNDEIGQRKCYPCPENAVCSGNAIHVIIRIISIFLNYTNTWKPVVHEHLVLELLMLLVETPTDDSVEVAITFFKECGMKLTEVSRKMGLKAILETLRYILHKRQLNKRLQHMIDVVLRIYRDGFEDRKAIPKELDLVEEENQFTHLITLDEAIDSHDKLNVFKFDDKYAENEEKYTELIQSNLHYEASSESGNEDDNFDDDTKNKSDLIVDSTDTNLTYHRRIIHQTFQSLLDFKECALLLMKFPLKPGQKTDLCYILLDCCAEVRKNLALKMAIVNKMIHLLSLALIFFSVINFSDSLGSRLQCKFGSYAAMNKEIGEAQCYPCPKNAVCMNNKIHCKKGYTLLQKQYSCAKTSGKQQ